MRWFIRRLNIDVYHENVREPLFFAFTGDMQGHMTSSVKMVHFVKTGQGTEHISLQVIRVKSDLNKELEHGVKQASFTRNTSNLQLVC